MNNGRNGKKRACGKIAAVLLASLLLTGCGNAIPDLTAEEQQAVGDYAAMTLLRYDANHRSRLVDLSQVRDRTSKPETDAPEPEQPDQTPEPESDTPVVDLTQGSETGSMGGTASMEEFFELPEGITLTYQGMQVCASYPEDGADAYFSLDASEGKSLLVLHYAMSSQASEEQRVDLFGQKPVFKITVNGSYTRTALVTILVNDMSTYAGDIAPGASEDLVLLIEIDEGMADGITSITLNLQSDSKTFAASLM